MRNRILAGLALAVLTGCASLERTSPGMMNGLDVVGGTSPAEQTICARVNGFGLLYICTLICGDVAFDNASRGVKGGFLLFQDRCNGADCYRTLHAIANSEGRQLTNVNMFNNSLPQQGVTGYADFIAWFFESEDVGCSGVLRAKK